MGEIACVFKVMPDGEDADLEKLKDEIKEKVDIQDIGEEDVAFGLKAIKVSAITTDEKGGTDFVENQLSEVDNVQSIELEHFDKL